MAPPRKRAGTTQPRGGTRRQGITLAQSPEPPKIPTAPNPHGGLLTASKTAWVAFWESISAAAAEQVDLVVAERWILAYDEHRRSLTAVRKARIVAGSTGQPVLNPLATWVASREAAMHKAEQQLGIGMKNRADLAIGVGTAKMTAEQLNRMTEEPGDHSDGDEEVEVVDAELLEEFAEAT